MKSSLTKISAVVRSLKGLMIALTCAVMLSSISLPAFAFGMNTSSSPTEGTAKLNQAQQESEDVIKGQPRGMNAVQEKAQRGLNGVQGAADTGKMKSPGDSEGATTVRGEIKDVLDQ